MDNHQRIEKIEGLIEQYQLDSATELIENGLNDNNNNLDLLCLKGKILTKKQQYGDALNIYNHVLNIDPAHQKASTAIKMINGILEIRRTFYFENPYTDDDLYDL